MVWNFYWSRTPLSLRLQGYREVQRCSDNQIVHMPDYLSTNIKKEVWWILGRTFYHQFIWMHFELWKYIISWHSIMGNSFIFFIISSYLFSLSFSKRLLLKILLFLDYSSKFLIFIFLFSKSFFLKILFIYS